MSETNVVKEIMLACSNGATRLFKLTTGMGWVGNFKRVKNMLVGTTFRPLRAGLTKSDGELLTGASDLNGWTTITMTPEWAERLMGRKIAVYTVIEVKDLKGVAKKHQKTFVERIRFYGGIAGFAKSPEQAQAVIDSWPYDDQQQGK
jgi:hypothetical protein